jgi:hypothetical protein
MYCEALKNLIIYGGCVAFLPWFVMMTIVQSKFIHVVRIHNVRFNDIRKSSEDLPIEVRNQLRLLKKLPTLASLLL